MKTYWFLTLLLALTLVACDNPVFVQDAPDVSVEKYGPPNGGGGGGNGGHETTAGNNLSFPVIWAEGVTKTVPGTEGTVTTEGAFVYWWGLDPEDDTMTCLPSPADPTTCLDGSTPPPEASMAWVQKDAKNSWRAESRSASPSIPVNIDVVDWGDALESQDWYTTSKVRIEHTLTELVADQLFTGETTLLGYNMLHTSGWGIDEVWGLQTDLSKVVATYESPEATVFSKCARLTIQQLFEKRGLFDPTNLAWDPVNHRWTEALPSTDPLYKDLINEDEIFNLAVHEAMDGPGFFNAEINVKGKIIFGYTWNVKADLAPASDYRLTLSIDQDCPGVTVNTFFTETTVVKPLEEGEETEPTIAAEGAGGAALVDALNNLTYMDIRILGRKTGGGGNPNR